MRVENRAHRASKPSPAAARRPLPQAGEVSIRNLWVMIRPRDVGGVDFGRNDERGQQYPLSKVMYMPQILLIFNVFVDTIKHEYNI